MEIGELLNDMRLVEENGSKSQLMLALSQGRSAMQVKRLYPKTWKSELLQAVGRQKSTWHQRVAMARDFAEFLLPEIPPEHVNTLPSSLALLTQLTKGTDKGARRAHLDEIAGLSFADVKKYVAERKGKIPCECEAWEEKIIKVCKSCGKKQKADDGGA